MLGFIMKKKSGVLIINLGTPDSSSVADVRRYLREFLMDGRVIDIPWLNRFLLVQGIIAPTRAPQSAKIYQELWMPDGSPLKIYGEGVVKLLQAALGEDYHVALGMRYQNPSIAKALEPFKDRGIEDLTVIPLYPQYASASTGSTIEMVFELIKSWQVIPSVKVISQFLDHPLFLKAFVELGAKHMVQTRYDHFIFSYHGLPERQIKKAAVENYCQLNEKCCSAYHAKNRYCYRAQCFETTRSLVKGLGIAEGQTTVCFQSRLGKDPWIKPYTDEVIKHLAAAGVKNVLAFSPSFVSDCLETTVEIGVEYKHMFEQCGGQRWDMVESLNDSPQWIECLKSIILMNSQK